MTLTIHLSTMLVDDSATKVIIVGAPNPEEGNNITHNKWRNFNEHLQCRLRIGERERESKYHAYVYILSERVLEVILTLSLGPTRLTTATEKVYFLNGNRLSIVPMLTLPWNILSNGCPSSEKTFTVTFRMGVWPLKPIIHARDTSLSSALATIRENAGTGGTAQENRQVHVMCKYKCIAQNYRMNMNSLESNCL